MIEKRKTQRWRSYLAGQAVFNRRQSAVDCMIRNLGGHGARISFGDGIAIPSAFELKFLRDGNSRPARMIWRTATEAGLCFDAEADESVFPIAAAREIAKLRQERDRLKARVSELSE